MGALLKRYSLFLGVVGAIALAFPFRPEMARLAAQNALQFFGQVLLIVPLVMVLTGLFDAWVPRRLIEENIGPRSGARGAFLSVMLGTAAAGPLYAAFPVATALQKKGARLANLVIFLGTWATIKLPMLLLESRFLGIRFALIRLALTVPGVLATGFLMERWLATPAVPVDPIP